MYFSDKYELNVDNIMRELNPKSYLFWYTIWYTTLSTETIFKKIINKYQWVIKIDGALEKIRTPDP